MKFNYMLLEPVSVIRQMCIVVTIQKTHTASLCSARETSLVSRCIPSSLFLGFSLRLQFGCNYRSQLKSSLFLIESNFRSRTAVVEFSETVIWEDKNRIF